MADPLQDRIATGVETVISAQLPSAQILPYGSTTEAGATYISIRANLSGEDPPGTGIFTVDVEVKMHGDHAADDIYQVETLFNNSFALAASLRTAGAGSYVLVASEAVEIDETTRTGVGNDLETTFSFGVWAQTQEVSDAA